MTLTVYIRVCVRIISPASVLRCFGEKRHHCREDSLCPHASLRQIPSNFHMLSFHRLGTQLNFFVSVEEMRFFTGKQYFWIRVDDLCVLMGCDV